MGTGKKVRNYSFILGSITFFAYFICYSGRSILSAIIPQMTATTAFTKENLGSMGSAFFITYGLGQILNGIVGDRVKTKIMVGAGLLLSGIVMVAFSFIQTQLAGVLLWSACGLLCSMLWAPISKVIAENCTTDKAQVYMTGLSAASILGSMASYGIASGAALLGNWKSAFYIAAGLLIPGAIIWYVTMEYLERKDQIRRILPVRQEKGKDSNVLKVLLQNAIIPMLLVSIINGIIRNAVVFWIPTYISERLGASPAAASGISGILPLFNLLGTFAGMVLFRKLGKNEYKAILALFVCCTAMFIAMGFMGGKYYVLNIAALFISSAAMSSASNLYYSVYCVRFGMTGYLSTITGILNFVSYASASWCNTFFMRIVTRRGWDVTVFVWVALAILGVAVSLWSQLSAGRSERRMETSH